jgi:hypothetical protein
MGRRASGWSEHAPKNGRGRKRAERAKSAESEKSKSELHVCAPCANHETQRRKSEREREIIPVVGARRGAETVPRMRPQ